MLTKHSAILALLVVAGCAGRSSSSIVPDQHVSTAAEQLVTIGASSDTTTPEAALSVTIHSRKSEKIKYSFPSDVTIFRRHTQSSGDMFEFHGKTTATFIPIDKIGLLERRNADGTSDRIALASVAVRESRSHLEPRCTLIPWNRFGQTHIAGCNGGDDPGPCPDCSGPMAPGGDLACHYTASCGGDPSLGTGTGIGIFRLTNPQISCYFSFTDSSYACDTNGINNSDSSAQGDYTLGYEYNTTLRAAVLHCAGPSANSEVLVGGTTPDGIINLGFHPVSAGIAKGWVMPTVYSFNTSMTAVYFTLRLPSPISGKCSGSN